MFLDFQNKLTSPFASSKNALLFNLNKNSLDLKENQCLININIIKENYS